MEGELSVSVTGSQYFKKRIAKASNFADIFLPETKDELTMLLGNFLFYMKNICIINLADILYGEVPRGLSEETVVQYKILW